MLFWQSLHIQDMKKLYQITVDMLCSLKYVNDFSVVMKFSKHSVYPRNFNFIDTTCSSDFHTDGAGGYKIEFCLSICKYIF